MLCILPPPQGAQLPAQGCLRGKKRHSMPGSMPPAAPPVFGGEGTGEWAQVAKLSAGRPDIRIWELLLLRMESWVPPFTPLLARDGCRCLKSTVKYRFTFQLRHLRLTSACTCREQLEWSLLGGHPLHAYPPVCPALRPCPGWHCHHQRHPPTPKLQLAVPKVTSGKGMPLRS